MQLLGYNGVLASFLPFINAFRVEIFKFLIDVSGIFGNLNFYFGLFATHSFTNPNVDIL